MIWTRRKPEKAGFYWWRRVVGKNMVVRVCGRYIDHFDGSFSNYLDELDGEWSSEPIEPPNEST